MILERIDSERGHINEITQGRLPMLYTSFDKIRGCASFQLEECLSPQASPERLKPQPDRLITPISFNLSPISFDLQSRQESNVSPLPSPLSISSEIGAWITNVVNQAMQSPTGPPPSFKIVDPRLSYIETTDDRAPSRGTFYAESTKSNRTGIGPIGRSRSPIRSSNPERVDSLQLVMKEPKLPKSKMKNSFYPIASTVISSEERSIIHHKLTNDKIAVAKNARRCLSRDQRSGLDWILKNISTDTTPSEVEHILWEGADPNAPEIEFGTVLIRAAYAFSTSILQLLVEYGADLTQTSHTVYYSAIHAAVLGKQLQNVKCLVDMGIFFDTPNQQGETPLHLAVKTPGGYPIAKWLLEIGADVNRESLDRMTPFQMVLGCNKVEAKERTMVMELLLAQGADGQMSKDSTMSRGKGLSVLGLI